VTPALSKYVVHICGLSQTQLCCEVNDCALRDLENTRK